MDNIDEKKPWRIIWSDEYLSGNELLDNYHKEIVQGIGELYELCTDTRENMSKIPDLAKKVETQLVEHMDLEIDYLKKFNLEYKTHEESHNFFRKELEKYKNYYIPPVIRAILICETGRDYMKRHFFRYDIRDIPKINECLKKEKNT